MGASSLMFLAMVQDAVRSDGTQALGACQNLVPHSFQQRP